MSQEFKLAWLVWFHQVRIRIVTCEKIRPIFQFWTVIVSKAVMLAWLMSEDKRWCKNLQQWKRISQIITKKMGRGIYSTISYHRVKNLKTIQVRSLTSPCNSRKTRAKKVEIKYLAAASRIQTSSSIATLWLLCPYVVSPMTILPAVPPPARHTTCHPWIVTAKTRVASPSWCPTSI